MVFNLYPLDDEHAGVAADYYNLLIYQPPPTVPVLVLSVMGWPWLGRGGWEGWLAQEFNNGDEHKRED